MILSSPPKFHTLCSPIHILQSAPLPFFSPYYLSHFDCVCSVLYRFCLILLSIHLRSVFWAYSSDIFHTNDAHRMREKERKQNTITNNNSHCCVVKSKREEKKKLFEMKIPIVGHIDNKWMNFGIKKFVQITTFGSDPFIFSTIFLLLLAHGWGVGKRESAPLYDWNLSTMAMHNKVDLIAENRSNRPVCDEINCRFVGIIKLKRHTRRRW